MAAVSVFVDEAIRGTLPLVCAKTGEPADLVIRMRQPVGGGMPAVAWLLVVLGPPGWSALFVVALLTSGREYITARVPQTEAVYHYEKRLERFRTGAFLAGVAALLYGMWRPGMFPVLWLAAGAVLLVAAVSLHFMVWRQAIGVALDGSRRWVTLTGVHPDFVRAAELQEAGARR